jgi:hypothetical protein
VYPIAIRESLLIQERYVSQPPFVVEAFDQHL